MNKKSLMIVALVVVVLVGLCAVSYYTGFASRLLGGNEYKAVFLGNGQVYFGRLFNERSQYAVLKEVFYLQITQAPQPLKPGETPPTNINVVKLGGELHGPTDEMRINRDQILFIETLKSDSRVVQAIEQFKAGNKNK